MEAGREEEEETIVVSWVRSVGEEDAELRPPAPSKHRCRQQPARMPILSADAGIPEALPEWPWWYYKDTAAVEHSSLRWGGVEFEGAGSCCWRLEPP